MIPAEKIAEMNNMLIHVLTDGTGRAAQIPGIIAGGKTGTTNGSTNAWFNGFTGNLVCSVWFGNDDNTPMGNMTGGTLPAQSWHEIMLYAHQGLDMKPPYGVLPATKAPEVAAAQPARGAPGEAERPIIALSPRATQIIKDIADLALADKQQVVEGADSVSINKSRANGLTGSESTHRIDTTIAEMAQCPHEHRAHNAKKQQTDVSRRRGKAEHVDYVVGYSRDQSSELLFVGPIISSARLRYAGSHKILAKPAIDPMQTALSAVLTQPRGCHDDYDRPQCGDVRDRKPIRLHQFRGAAAALSSKKRSTKLRRDASVIVGVENNCESPGQEPSQRNERARKALPFARGHSP